jgi:hypothetical protein
MSATTEDAVRYVEQTYQDYHRRGLKFAEAREAAAHALGLTPRRVVQLRGREVLPRADEALTIRERFRRHLAHEAARLEQEAIVLRRRRDAIG